MFHPLRHILNTLDLVCECNDLLLSLRYFFVSNLTNSSCKARTTISHYHVRRKARPRAWTQSFYIMRWILHWTSTHSRSKCVNAGSVCSTWLSNQWGNFGTFVVSVLLISTCPIVQRPQQHLSCRQIANGVWTLWLFFQLSLELLHEIFDVFAQFIGGFPSTARRSRGIKSVEQVREFLAGWFVCYLAYWTLHLFCPQP